MRPRSDEPHPFCFFSCSHKKRLPHTNLASWWVSGLWPLLSWNWAGFEDERRRLTLYKACRPLEEYSLHWSFSRPRYLWPTSPVPSLQVVWRKVTGDQGEDSNGSHQLWFCTRVARGQLHLSKFSFIKALHTPDIFTYVYISEACHIGKEGRQNLPWIESIAFSFYGQIGP